MTIKQLLDAEEAYSGAGDFKIDNSSVSQVTIVGQIRETKPQHTHISFSIDDGTGQIDVKKWIDADKKDESPQLEFEHGSNVRVWGRLGSYGSKREVKAHIIRPITDYNEVNYHMLEATYCHLYYTKGPLGENGARAGDEGSMFVDGGDSYDSGSHMAGRLAGFSASARKVFQFIKANPAGDEGAHLNIITNGTGLSAREVLAASEELSAHSLIYSTMDNETWNVLDM